MENSQGVVSGWDYGDSRLGYSKFGARTVRRSLLSVIRWVRWIAGDEHRRRDPAQEIVVGALRQTDTHREASPATKSWIPARYRPFRHRTKCGFGMHDEPFTSWC